MPTGVDQTLQALERLLNLFRFERRVYLAVTFGAVVALFVAFAFLLYRKDDIMSAVGMCGSGGVIAFTSSRLLTMWDQAFKLVEVALKTEPTEGNR